MSTTHSPFDNALTIIEALIDGLRIADRKLNDKCLTALRSIGGRVRPHLEAAVSNPATRPPQRRRLIEAAEQIANSQAVGPDLGRHVLEALLDSLRGHNPQLNLKATAALGCLRGELINHLITEAVTSFMKPGYCARLLSALETLAPQLKGSQYLELSLLLSHDDEKIRLQTGRLLGQFSLVATPLLQSDTGAGLAVTHP